MGWSLSGVFIILERKLAINLGTVYLGVNTDIDLDVVFSSIFRTLLRILGQEQSG